MSLKLHLYILIGVFFTTATWAQQKEESTSEKDSLDLNSIQDLDPVILTGQFNAQSVDQSIFEVDVITRADIEKMAGSSLDDVLKQTLNLNVTPSAGEGRSGIQQFGFGSEYIKILVDGIPIIGDEGFGNAIDISQINLDDIEQIEIVEGAMAVQYGANAVTGVINIITKKYSHHNWSITPYVQEESLGSEYNWADEGRHIQSLKISRNISDHWFAEVSYLRNDFRGFYGEKKGRYYFNPEQADDRLRGYDWLPKIQNNAKGLLRYRKANFNVFYKFEYFHEQTDQFTHKVLLNENEATQTVHPTANDEVYKSQRFYHHLNINGKLKKRMNYDLSLSYQEQKRSIETFTRKLITGEKYNSDGFDYNTREGIYSRGSINQILKSDRYNFEVGYEVDLDKGTGSGLSEQNASEDTQNNRLNTYSGFTSAELKFSNRLSIRPGIRYIHSNKFSDQYAYSVSGKYQFKNNYQLRLVAGTSPKIPNFEQLYFYLVDSNHNVQGNENLNPERGKSVFIHLKKNFKIKNQQLRFQPKISMWYLDVKDKIDLIITERAPLTYQYHNVDRYRTWGLAMRNKFTMNQLSAGLGLALNGESKVLNSAVESDDYDDDYLYALQLTGQLSYSIPKWETVLSTSLKYNGSHYQFISNIGELDGDEITKDKQEGYGWWNASVKKHFLDRKVELTMGARNLLDVTDVKTSSGSDIGHGGETSSMLLGYGRSYFFKVLYNLNF